MEMIHPSAVISDSAKIGENTKIGPFCFIGPNVEIGENNLIHSHVVITGKTKIGRNNQIFPFASIGQVPQDLKYENEDSEVIIGDNNAIREYVTIQLGTKGGEMKTRIGNNCLLMVGTHIAHDCIVGDNAIFANLATLAGHVTVGDFAVLGGLAAVHQHVRIGRHAMIGGGAIILRDIPPYATASSDHAYIEGLNLIGLKRRGFDKESILELQKAMNYIFFDANADFAMAVKNVRNQFNNNQLVQEFTDFLMSDSKRSFATARK